jgi:uncharacterized phage-associated protein
MAADLPTIKDDATAAPDARAVANLMLDRAELHRLRLSNLRLQKLLYFAHGRHLVVQRRPLVSGHFEAWKFGPVHPVVYGAFKTFGDAPITGRAVKRHPLTGVETALPAVVDDAALEHVDGVLVSLGRLPSGRLVELSHAPNGPWAYVVNKASTSAALGMRISDTVIRDRFVQMIPIRPETPNGEPVEDSPLA